jgi:predicted PurR-regulated permease PerM
MLKRLENESNQINQSQSHDKFSLELEIERIQRDLLNSTQEIQSFKEENESLKNQISKFQATISSLVRFFFSDIFSFSLVFFSVWLILLSLFFVLDGAWVEWIIEF